MLPLSYCKALCTSAVIHTAHPLLLPNSANKKKHAQTSFAWRSMCTALPMYICIYSLKEEHTAPNCIYKLEFSRRWYTGEFHMQYKPVRENPFHCI